MQIVSEYERQLKWRAFDWIETSLSVVCGVLLATFTFATLINVIARINSTPITGLDEVIVGAFIWGIFLGASVAVRRNQHFRIASFVDSLPRYWRLGFETLTNGVVLIAAVCILIFGYVNFLQGFRNFLETTGTPIAVITASVPVFGAFTLIFTVERMINIWRVILSPDYQADSLGTVAPVGEKDVV